MSLKTQITFIMVTSMIFFTSVCQACPSCAADDSNSSSSFVVLAGMIIMPMLVAAVTIPLVLRLIQGDNQTNLPDFVMHEKGSGS